MKFTINKEDFLKGLSLVQGVVEKKKTLPILSNVLIETDLENQQIILTATDLEVGIKSRYKAEIEQEGKITVSAKKIFEIVKEITESNISIQVKENNWLEIKSGNAKFNMVGLSPDEFPYISEKSNDNYLEIDSTELKNLIDKTYYAISNDESKFNLNGIYFHNFEEKDQTLLRLVSTDGHRLSLVQGQYNSKNIESLEKGIIFPKKGLNELKKITDSGDEKLKIYFVENSAVVKNSETTLVMRLIDGDFPDYNRVIPKDKDNFAEIDCVRFLHILRRISILANEKSRGINLTLKNNKLEMTSSNPEFGDAIEFLDIDYTGNEITIGFNAKYLLDVINNIDTDNIRIYIKDNMSPCLIVPSDNEDNLSVIMPMRI